MNNVVNLIVKEYKNIENNWLMTEIEVQIDGVIYDRSLHVVSLKDGKRVPYIDDVWEFDWEEII